MNEAFVAFCSTLILICRTSRITLCGKSCDLERKYVVFASPVSQKQRRQPIFFFILDSLSAQINVFDTIFSSNTMKLLNHPPPTLTKQNKNKNKNKKKKKKKTFRTIQIQILTRCLFNS